MMNSNIAAGSNVYLSKENDPRHDPEFIAQILDYDRLKDIVERRKVDNRIPFLSSKQISIVHRGIRCTFAKNDPCIGPVAGGKNDCKCININCPGIYDQPSFYGKSPWKGCNPDITEEYIKQWTPDLDCKKQYGNPEQLRRYYIVDMVSDKEMSRYDSNPINEGYVYPIPPDPVVVPDGDDKKSKEAIYKIDPDTGRRMTIIGHRWVITDNASYEDEELLPIWGFVEEVEEKKGETSVRKKAKRIEKKQEEVSKKRNTKTAAVIRDPDFKRKEEFEKAVAANIVEEIKLTDIDPNIISDEEELVVLLDNPAELAFVSGTFLISAILHGIDTNMPVQLALIDDYLKYTGKTYVMISNTVLKSGCKESNVQAWKTLAAKSEINLLHVAERDYYRFVYGDQKSCWTCRNMYGVTHVCVEHTDISEIASLSDGLYPVSLVDDGNSYMILKKNGDLLGRLGNTFVERIDTLKTTGEIAGTPANITGIALQVKDGKHEILGMGHLKFIEY